jgi:hypothetical protein
VPAPDWPNEFRARRCVCTSGVWRAWRPRALCLYMVTIVWSIPQSPFLIKIPNRNSAKCFERCKSQPVKKCKFGGLPPKKNLIRENCFFASEKTVFLLRNGNKNKIRVINVDTTGSIFCDTGWIPEQTFPQGSRTAFFYFKRFPLKFFGATLPHTKTFPCTGCWPELAFSGDKVSCRPKRCGVNGLPEEWKKE